LSQYFKGLLATSKMEQIVTIQRVAINTHKIMDLQHASIMNHGHIMIGHSSEEGRFITWKSETFHGDKLLADQTFYS
jgi:hypothetical protein